MNLLELKQKIDSMCERYNEDYLECIQICIPIEKVGASGGTPTVPVKSAIKGFDWDNNKLMLYPETNLMLENPDTLDKLREECRTMGWTQYENNNLKRENKRLHKIIAELRSPTQ